MNKTIPYRRAIYANCGFPMETINYAPKTAETVKRSREENAYRECLAIDALILFTDLGYKLSMTMTSLMFFVALFTGIYAVATYLMVSPEFLIYAGLPAYGLNRYRFEEWVRENYPDALIIRLPGLFGKNLKKILSTIIFTAYRLC